ncbi:TonB-dependent receptor plug domain-containing protein [Methylobacter sp.]|uniref:TonB-dependent receptor plug domain-containing protein n=1 Tax=Methylobacter sp. TaxID=2051955 RepID=UPI002FDECBFB
MRIKFAIAANCLAIMCYPSLSVAAVENEMDDFFAMSPAQLAATSVTIATGTPKTVSQSAAVTSVITAEQIKSMGATELHEVLETVPGMHGSLQRSTYDYNYSVRGIQNATNSQLLILLNGTRITTPFRGTLMSGMELPVEAIQRVEVIRGPGSALYGADAFAGVINIITKKAADINGSKVGVRAGEWDTQSAWGQHGAKWAGWDVGTSLQYQHTGGDDGRVLNADAQTIKDNAFGTHASHAPGAMPTGYETLNGHLALQRKHWDIGFWGFNEINGGTRAGVNTTLDPNGTTNGEQYLGDVRFSTEDWFKDWELMAHLSYLQADFNAKFQVFPDNASLPVTVIGNIDNTLDPLVPRVLFPNGVNNSLGRVEKIPSIELSSLYQGWNNHRLLLSSGFRYEEITTSESRNFGYGMPLAPVVNGALIDLTGTQYVYLPDTHRSIGSAVVQDEWQFADNWQLTAGVRYDHYSDFGGTINPRAALVWDINQQLTSKVLYGKAFRAPNFSEQGNQNNPVIVGNKELKPETINTVEWAFDYRPFSTLRTAANLYYYEIENLIAIPQGTVTFQNSGNQNGYGTELEWNWQATEQWNVIGNYAWQNARNSTGNSRITGVPEHHVYMAVGWQFLPQWQLQPQINWVGGRTTAPGDTRPLKDYETIDATLRGKRLFGHLNLAASMRNMLDTNNFEPASPALPQNIPLPGRSFYFEASTDF